MGISGITGAITPDGKTLLVAEQVGTCYLDIIDTATFQELQRISLGSALGAGGSPGRVVIAGNKAYIESRYRYQIAVVDLTTYAISSIILPQGNFSTRNSMAATPDGSTLVVAEHQNADKNLHIVLVSTATNQIVADKSQSGFSYAYALAVTPDGSDPSKIFGYVGTYANGTYELLVLDLRTGSQTYGQLLSNTAISLGSSLNPYDMAVNSDGTRLIPVGFAVSQPGPNAAVVDTAKMFSDPSHAVLTQLTVDGGWEAIAVCTGFFAITPPNTAPVVTGVSGNVTNDTATQIEITGGNFQQGALAQIGDMAPIAAMVTGGNALNVTVPENAPAGNALNIIITNPLTNDPPDQQNQSGILAGKFAILLNSKIQPTTQFATTNYDNSVSIYSVAQRDMANVKLGQIGYPYWPAFNIDGKGLYVLEDQFYGDTSWSVIPVDLTSNLPGPPIALDSNAYQVAYPQGIAASQDPTSGTPVVNVPWNDYSDIHVSVIDSDSGSPTFNTIIRTFAAGINDPDQGVYLDLMTVRPDGKFAYLWYDDYDYNTGRDIYYLGILNLSNGTFTHVTADSLGAYDYQQQVSVSPDGQSLLLASYRGDRARVKVINISDPIRPKPFAELTPVPVPGRGFPYVFNYQVVGNKLYAIDTSGIVVVFNFDKQKGDFRERGYSVSGSSSSYYGGFSFSPDGLYMYVSDTENDQVLVLDVSRLSIGKGVLLTSVRAPYLPYTMAVSPVPPPIKAATAKHLSGQHGSTEQRSVQQREKGSKIVGIR